MSNLLIKKLCLIIISFSILFFWGCSKKNKNDISINTKSIDSIRVINGKIKKLAPLLLPDTSSTSKGIYSGIGSFCFVPPNKIFYLDIYYYKIKVISSENGVGLFNFGNRGSGPGEFKPQPSLKYIDNYGVLTIDNTQYRLTLFDIKGQVKKTIKIKEELSDFIFLNDSLVLTGSFMLIPDYKPLKIISLKFDKIITEFGTIIEPQDEIIEKVNASSFTKGYQSLFSHMSMVSLLLLPNGKEIIYSQSQPYALYKYNLNDFTFVRFDAKLPFSTNNNMKLEFDEDKEIASSKWEPSGKIMAPKLLNNKIVVPIFSLDALVNYLDVYSLSGKLEKRFSIPPLPGLYAYKVIFNTNGKEMFVIVGNKNRLYWIEKFKIDASVYE